MNYSPKGMYVWDAWYMARGNEVHAYHLQRWRPGPRNKGPRQDCVGHAVTRDLIEWEERPPAMAPVLLWVKSVARMPDPRLRLELVNAGGWTCCLDTPQGWMAYNHDGSESVVTAEEMWKRFAVRP